MTTPRTRPHRLPKLGQRVRQLRKEAGLTIQQLAVAAGLHASSVHQLERSVHPDPRISTLAAVGRALGVALDDLIG